ncbi:hypothetical protein PSHT_12529 [Puccinia striiformis]|uniref:Uncharacterized protein n=1 Tax=Puccinia striiformis TaxID=27350 RepID=A0A2S4UW55_9BASI|nr:hypothetical protein PSHT_12529 [Puccinia striiformis]
MMKSWGFHRIGLLMLFLSRASRSMVPQVTRAVKARVVASHSEVSNPISLGVIAGISPVTGSRSVKPPRIFRKYRPKVGVENIVIKPVDLKNASIRAPPITKGDLKQLEVYLSTVNQFRKEYTTLAPASELYQDFGDSERNLNAVSEIEKDFKLTREILKQIMTVFEDIGVDKKPQLASLRGLMENMGDLNQFHELLSLITAHEDFDPEVAHASNTRVLSFVASQKGLTLGKVVAKALIVSTTINPSLRRIVSKLMKKYVDLTSDPEASCLGGVGKFLSQELNELLHRIGQFDNKNKIDLNQTENQVIIEIRSLVFQTIEHLYKKKLINQEEFTEFFRTKNTMEIAANTMVTSHRIKFGMDKDSLSVEQMNSKVFDRNCNLSHFRSIPKGLESNDKRLFSYLSLKSFLSYNYVLPSSYNEIMQDNRLFYMLENYNRAKSGTREEWYGFEKGLQYKEIKEILKSLKESFLDDREKSTQERILSFYILEFVEANYGWEALEMMIDGDQKLSEGRELKLKMASMSTSFVVFEELDNIRWYLRWKFTKDQPESLPFITFAWDNSKLDPTTELDLISKYLKVNLAFAQKSKSENDSNHIYLRLSSIENFYHNIQDLISDLSKSLIKKNSKIV